MLQGPALEIDCEGVFAKECVSINSKWKRLVRYIGSASGVM